MAVGIERSSRSTRRARVVIATEPPDDATAGAERVHVAVLPGDGRRHFQDVGRLCAVFLRQREMNRGSAANRADGPNPAAVRFNDTLADGESKPGAGARRPFGLPEAVEDDGQILFR